MKGAMAASVINFLLLAGSCGVYAQQNTTATAEKYSPYWTGSGIPPASMKCCSMATLPAGIVGTATVDSCKVPGYLKNGRNCKVQCSSTGSIGVYKCVNGKLVSPTTLLATCAASGNDYTFIFAGGSSASIPFSATGLPSNLLIWTSNTKYAELSANSDKGLALSFQTPKFRGLSAAALAGLTLEIYYDSEHWDLQVSRSTGEVSNAKVSPASKLIYRGPANAAPKTIKTLLAIGPAQLRFQLKNAQKVVAVKLFKAIVYCQCKLSQFTEAEGILKGNCPTSLYNGQKCKLSCAAGFTQANPAAVTNAWCKQGVFSFNQQPCIPIDHCADNPCGDGGVCVDSLSGFTCVCRDGFSGPTCEPVLVQVIGTGACSVVQCLNGGTCVNNNDGRTFTCNCAPNYTGVTCEDLISPCSPSPCQNGGTCNVNGEAARGFSCTCPTGYHGTKCEIANNSCNPNPCKNNGVCKNTAGGFTCTCPEGYTSADCSQVVDQCATNPCQNGGTCVSSGGSFTCQCASGYQGAHCVDLTSAPECAGNPCGANGVCDSNNARTAYVCYCNAGYTSQGGTCVDIDECAANPCQNGGVCTNSPGSFSCNCAGSGFEGTFCEVNVDDCAPNPCNGHECVDGINSYTCNCYPGAASGTNCETQCFPVCRNGECSATNTCVCKTGWAGADCSTPLCTTKTCNTYQQCVAPNVCACKPMNSGGSTFSACNAVASSLATNDDMRLMYDIRRLIGSQGGTKGTLEQISARSLGNITEQLAQMNQLYTDLDLTLLWGPAYVMEKNYVPGDETSSFINAAYAAIDRKTKIIYVGISGTNPASFENFIDQALDSGEIVPWPYTTDSITGVVGVPSIFKGTFYGFTNIRDMKPLAGFPGAGSTLPDMLRAQVTKLPQGQAKIRFSGHSLGGALAPLLALYMHEAVFLPNKISVDITVNTYAGYGPGNKAFITYYGKTALGPKTNVGNNDFDVVPTLFDMTLMGGIIPGVPLGWKLGTRIENTMKANGVQDYIASLPLNSFISLLSKNEWMPKTCTYHASYYLRSKVYPLGLTQGGTDSPPLNPNRHAFFSFDKTFITPTYRPKLTNVALGLPEWVPCVPGLEASATELIWQHTTAYDMYFSKLPIDPDAANFDIAALLLEFDLASLFNSLFPSRGRNLPTENGFYGNSN